MSARSFGLTLFRVSVKSRVEPTKKAGRFSMKSLRTMMVAVSCAWLFSSPAFAGQGPVQFARQGDRITLSNDYLERVLQIMDGTLSSAQFTNRLSHQTYTLCGDEFEIDLVYGQLKRDSENPQPISSRDLKVSSVEAADTPQGGRRILFHLEPRHPISDYTGLHVTAFYELNPGDFFTRQWLQLAITGKGTIFVHAVWPHTNHWSPSPFRLGGLGQPLLSDDLFLGLEYPSSMNTERSGDVELGSIVGLNIPPEGYTTETAVVGVAATGNAHEAFMDYVQRIRMSRPRLFVLYNTWYDLQGTVMNSKNVLERISILEENLQRKYSLNLDSFVLDDGWDDPKNLWRIDAQRFPGGFHDLVAALDSHQCKLGIWFGPLGGYGGAPATDRAVRIAAGRRLGMEVNSNGEYFCLAAKNYGLYLRDSMLRMIRDYGVNYFKLDGIPFACSDPEHGHPVGIYSREAYVRSVIDLVRALHAANPKAFIGLATGPWLSPWWLRYGDTVDYGGEDFAYLDAVPSFSARQSAMSYNDSVLYRSYAVSHMQFPMSSLDGEGIIKGSYNLLGGENEPLEDWQDAVVGSVGSGMMRQDLYLTPSLLKPPEWEVLGKSLEYAKANAQTLLNNGTWVLGDPAQGQAYGFVHSSETKTIVLLRNPSLQPARMSLPLTPENGFISAGQALKAEIIFPFREVLPSDFHEGDSLPALLDGFEQRVIELRPASAQAGFVEGVRYALRTSVLGRTQLTVFGVPGTSTPVRLTDPKATQTVELDGQEIPADSLAHSGTILVSFGREEPAGPAFSQPLIQVVHADDKGENAKVSLTVQIPADSQVATLGLLLQSAQPLGEVQADLRDTAQPGSLVSRKSSLGLWCWFGTQLGAGSHALEFTLHLPAGQPARPAISGWLRVRRKLAARELVLKRKAGQERDVLAGDPLPAASAIERKTYKVFDVNLQ
jgi:hypothetical protein